MKKRILVLLSAVALMVVLLAMSVAPAFAGPPTNPGSLHSNGGQAWYKSNFQAGASCIAYPNAGVNPPP
jgi:opacity protein-like surface antigen